MKGIRRPKLLLNRQTVRALSTDDLKEVAGGQSGNPYCRQSVIGFCISVDKCGPVGSVVSFATFACSASILR